MKARSKRDPLDPRRDPARWEGMVRSIMVAAGPELVRLRTARGTQPLLMLTHWFRPVLAAASVVLALAIATLARRSEPAVESWGVAEVLAPEPVAAWLLVGVMPTAEEIVISMEAGGQ